MDSDVSPSRTASSMTSGDLADMSSLSSKAASHFSSSGTSSGGPAPGRITDFVMPPGRGGKSGRWVPPCVVFCNIRTAFVAVYCWCMQRTVHTFSGFIPSIASASEDIYLFQIAAQLLSFVFSQNGILACFTFSVQYMHLSSNHVMNDWDTLYMTS